MYCNRGLVTLFYAGDTQGTTSLGCVIPLLVRDSVDKRDDAVYSRKILLRVHDFACLSALFEIL